MSIQVEQFVRTRQADWQELSRLIDAGQRSMPQLTPDEVQALSRLYRAATSDLALAQRDFPSHRATVYLNQLVARGHALIYREEPLALGRLRRFVTTGFPAAFRQTLPFFLAAALLFFGPALLTGALAAWQPEAGRWILPLAAQEMIPLIEQQDLWTEIAVEDRPYASSFIAQNNIRVAFLAFAGGILAGIPTVLVLISNGLMLGGITGLAIHYGIAFDLWTFVIGHGVLELSVICIAGGSGLMLGWAIVHPGWLSRRDALALAAQRAVRLIIGCVPLLLLAGMIEGFISPNEAIPWPVKWAIGLLSGLLLYTYLLLAGRRAAPAGSQHLPALERQVAVDHRAG
ncbi:MAG TPA: stage II sporulation protein M [Anaerolineae bacterium]|nr:stage II sporulation protein M [Anaerolineae bacterium]